jgi:hypothetical protein
VARHRAPAQAAEGAPTCNELADSTPSRQQSCHGTWPAHSDDMREGPPIGAAGDSLVITGQGAQIGPVCAPVSSESDDDDCAFSEHVAMRACVY